MADQDVLSSIIAPTQDQATSQEMSDVTEDDETLEHLKNSDDEGMSDEVEDTTEDGDVEDVVDEEDAEDAQEEPSEEEELPSDDSGDEYTFKVDGEEVTVSVDDLIKNYSIGSTAQKRLQEATEMRKSAQTEGYTEGMNAAKEVISAERGELDSMRQQLSGLLEHIGPALFQPQFEQPDPAMQATDPIGYLSQVEAFRQDQARIQGLQQTLAGTAQQIEAHQRQLLEQTQQNERIALHQARPDLSNPENVQTFTTNVRLAQDKLGFSQAEIDNFPDHRGLLVLEAAGKYFAMIDGKGETPAQRVVKKAGKTLKPGNAVQQRSTKQKQRRANLDRAKKTGTVSDVAKTLLR